jgi:cytochrome c553
MKLKPNIEAGKKTYELCASCHNTDGWGNSDGSFPVIAGQHRSVIIKQLADIRNRNRDNPTMFPFSGDDVLGGPQGIEDVAAYISQLVVNPSPGQGDGEHLELGEKLYKEKCIACHGSSGEGNADAFFPRIQGQHYAYLARQLEWIRDERRKNANPAMLAQIKDMDNKTLRAIADYVSRINVTEQSSK